MNVNRSGNPEIYKMPLDGGEAQQLTNDPAPDFLPTWSPDGQRIAFQSQRTGNRDLFVMSADGGPARQLTDAPGFDSDPEWSNDGRIFFNSDRAGELQIYSLSADRGELDGEDAQQLTIDGGLGPIASPDGRLVAYDSPDGLSVISTDGTDRRTLVPTRGRSGWQPRWSSDGSTIFGSDSFWGGRPSITGFWAVPVSGGQPKLLVRFDDPSRIRMYPRFGSDGQKFYFSLTEFESDLWLMELSWDNARSE